MLDARRAQVSQLGVRGGRRIEICFGADRIITAEGFPRSLIRIQAASQRVQGQPASRDTTALVSEDSQRETNAMACEEQ